MAGLGDLLLRFDPRRGYYRAMLPGCQTPLPMVRRCAAHAVRLGLTG
jgi:hypothetical protein